METFSYESTEPLVVRNIRTDVNPTANTVKMFVTIAGSAVPDVTNTGWVTGAWKTTALQSNGLWKTDAWFTITAHTYTIGVHDVYIYIDGSTYDPVRKAGQITVY